MNFLHKISLLFRKTKLDTDRIEEKSRQVALQTEKDNPFGYTQRTRNRAEGWIWKEQLMQDLPYAVRRLRKTPAFTVIALFILAVGIGANTALFNLANALLLRSLPVENPEELVLLAAEGPTDPTKAFPYPLFSKNGPNRAFPFTYYDHLSEQTRSLSSIAAFSGWPAFRQMTFPGVEDGDAEKIATFEVSGSYFPTLGAPATLGRLISEVDDQPNHARPVVVLSHDFWQRRFDADPTIIGQTLLLDGYPLSVVGVAARGFTGMLVGARTDLWLPLQLSPEIDQNQAWAGALKSNRRPWLNLFGRLKPGVSMEQARVELDGLYQRKLEELDPRRTGSDQGNLGVGLLRQEIGLSPAGKGYGGMRTAYARPTLVLMGMVGVLLLVTCANLAGLLLARGAAREREFIMRSALGATPSRLARQIITECLLLAVAGGIAGLGVAWMGTRWLAAYFGNIDLNADSRVAIFSLVATIATGILFSLLPAKRLSRNNLISASNSGARASIRLNQILVAFQIALAFLLCITATLLVRTFQQLATGDTGFQREELLLGSLDFERRAAPEWRVDISHRLVEELTAIPGVRSATAYQGIGLLGPLAIADKFTVAEGELIHSEDLTASIVAAGPGFFETMGIQIIQGIDFTATGVRNDSVLPVIISEWSAKRLFGEQSPIGRRIKLSKEFEIAGVARDIKYGNLRENPKFVFYVPLQQRPRAYQTLLALRTEPGASVALADVRSILQRLDPAATVSSLTPMNDVMSRLTRQERIAAQLAGFFGLFVLILASLGLFGLQSYNITRRTREIGVRLALGASPNAVRWLVLRQSMGLSILGCIVGAASSIGLMRFAQSLFYGVTATNPLLYASVFLVLVSTAGLASWLPARRATKVDPLAALKVD